MVNQIDSTSFCHDLKEWHNYRKRNFPWDLTKEPYEIYVSEIILQQTRTAQGLEYYKKFLDEFPTIQSLASAREEDVLRVWTGLGYYSRARNMFKATKIIVSDYDGMFPQSVADLLKLPGVGPYASRAIAAFAFQESVAAVDGNLRRVVSRLYAQNFGTRVSEIRKLQSTADALVAYEPDDWNRAMMNLASSVCLPKNPTCENCPVIDYCAAYKIGEIEKYPKKKKKLKKRTRYFHYLLIIQADAICVQKRQKKDIWQGLYELPLFETNGIVTPESRDWNENWNFNIELTKREKRILSHQNIELFFYTKLDDSQIAPCPRVVTLDQIKDYAFSKSVNDFLQEIISEL